MSNTTKVKLLSDKAELPTRAHASDTGYDLKMLELDTIKGDTLYFKTGIAIQPPEGYYYEVVPRSSISKLPLMLANSIGVIDEHYRGEIIVPIRVTHSRAGSNVGREGFPGGVCSIFDRKQRSLYDVAQLILREKPTLCQLILRKREDSTFEVASDIDETERGDGGFGSTDEPSQTITDSSSRKSLIKRLSD